MKRRGFTLVELAAVGVCLFVGGAVTVQPGISKARQSARQIKDSTQVRGIHQGLVLWAQNNGDRYTLPSLFDKKNETVFERSQAAKNTTANIMSMLIWNGFFSPELCVTPVEVNASIEVMKDYHYSEPPAAAKPKLALWDPAFSVDFTGDHKGNFSYSHLQPAAGRMARWSSTLNGEEVVLCTRTPRIKGVKYDEDKSATVTFDNDKSKTLDLFGHGKEWSGNAVFNDNHVDFADGKIAPGSTFTHETAPYYTGKDGRRLDCWCYDEPDDAAAVNNYVGIFVTAGSQPDGFRGIWD